MQNFVPANISYMHYRTLECVDPVPLSRTNHKFSTHKTRFKSKSQKNVPEIVTLR